MDIPILFEDDSFLVIHKPPGVVVNRAESVKGETIQDWAEDYLHLSSRPPSRDSVTDQDGEVQFYNRAGIVHRIDKETSGCLLIAKSSEMFITLQRLFKSHEIHKTYLAIVHGGMPSETGEIRAPVGRLPWNRERFGIVPGGKDAVTRYRVIDVIPASEPGTSERGWIPGQARNDKGEQLSLIELYPETGRTHQIRVHMKYINHPLVGDYLYAGRKTARADRLWVPRVMLHAWKLSFFHPVSKKQVTIEAPVPHDMMGIVRQSANGKSKH